jgi:hypothetical protein
MPTVQVPVQLTVDHLLSAVKQFLPAELQLQGPIGHPTAAA